MEVSRARIASLLFVATGLLFVALSFSLSWYRDWPPGYEPANAAYIVAAAGLVLGWIFLVSVATNLRLGSVVAAWASLVFVAIALAFFLWRVTQDDFSGSPERPVLASGFYLAMIGAGFITAAAWLRTEERGLELKDDNGPLPP